MRTLTWRGLPPPEFFDERRQIAAQHGGDLSPTPFEQEIIQDIFTRTNWYAWRLQGYETSEQEVALDVLPVLLEWMPRLNERPNFRACVYMLFNTSYAAPYVDTLVGWYESETDAVNHDILIQAICRVASPENAIRLWKVCQDNPPRHFRVLFMVTLLRFKSVEAEVRQALVELVHGEPPLAVYELRDLARVRDPRIRDWFKGQLGSSDRNIRAIASRYLRRGTKLPKGARISAVPPDPPANQLFSTEVDLDKLPDTLKALSRQFEFVIPAAFTTTRVLNCVEIDQWLTIDTTGTIGGRAISIWLRLEDLDIAEIVITETPGPR